MKPSILLSALTAIVVTSFSGGALAASASADEAAQTLRDAGYADVRDLEFDSGLWEAEVLRDNGRWGEVAVDAATGEIFDARNTLPLLPVEDVIAAVSRDGYTGIRDIDRDGALWEAEALDSNGQPVELRISGYDGRVISVENDRDD